MITLKKIKIGLLAFSAVTLTYCSEEELSTQNNSEIVTPEFTYSRKSELKQEFGTALVSSMEQSPMLKELIKGEALKMFNKDYEVLYLLIKDRHLENGVSVENLILSNLKDKQHLIELLSLEPSLTILVPELPEDSFSAKLWNTSITPAVAIRTNETNTIPLIDQQGILRYLPGDVIPGFPVIVVKNNERLISSENSSFNTLETEIVYDGPEAQLRFWSADFNPENDDVQKRRTRIIDQKLEDAYNIYNNADGWQRDYIYYDIQPSQTRNPFNFDYKEHIRSFGMIGNATNAYNKISDQAGDPTYSNISIGSTPSHWSGGFYEFKVRTIVNSKNGVGNELINGFTASPSDIFFLAYETSSIFGSLKIFRVTQIINQTMSVSLPLINWDLDEYASTIKIEVEEVDLTTTTVITDTRTVKFATNFEIDLNLGQKVKTGLKFGASLETTETNTVQKTFTQGNDFLGETIVNFADDVVLGRSGSGFFGKRWTIRDYSTGFCKFSVEPKRVQ